MKDDKGIYYLPYPQNPRIHMYVRKTGPDVCFRLWSADDDALWEQHGWVPFAAIKAATAMYTRKSGGLDPKAVYDLAVARELLREGAAD